MYSVLSDLHISKSSRISSHIRTCLQHDGQNSPTLKISINTSPSLIPPAGTPPRRATVPARAARRRSRSPVLGRLGDEYEVLVENFTCVEAGEVFARADGEELTAGESFYPVLLSADGYEEIFGYTAERVGTVP